MHIESRPSRRRKSEFEILVDVECDNKKMEQLTGMLKREVAAINLATFESGAEVPPPTPMSATASFGKKQLSLFKSNLFQNISNNIIIKYLFYK